MVVELVASKLILAIIGGLIALLLTILMVEYSGLSKKYKQMEENFKSLMSCMTQNENIIDRVDKLEHSLLALERIAKKIDGLKIAAEEIKEEDGKLIQFCSDNREAWLAMGERIDALGARVQELEAKVKIGYPTVP